MARTFRIEINIADRPSENNTYVGVILDWNEWPWLVWAKPVVDNPEFVRLEYVVGLTEVRIAVENCEAR